MSNEPAVKQRQPTGKSGTAGLSDVASLRRNTGKNIDQGAITDSYSAETLTP